jgi:shikimate kinase
VVLREENRRRLREAGAVVWLTADALTLWQRMQGDDSTAQRRPDLTVGGLAEVEDLLRQREPWYAACAHWAVTTADRPPAEVAHAVLSKVLTTPD